MLKTLFCKFIIVLERKSPNYLTITLRADSQRGAAEMTIARRKRGRVV